eukprot:scaffold76607_cov20-Tisochrysis_lutea.AAC.6
MSLLLSQGYSHYSDICSPSRHKITAQHEITASQACSHCSGMRQSQQGKRRWGGTWGGSRPPFLPSQHTQPQRYVPAPPAFLQAAGPLCLEPEL